MADKDKDAAPTYPAPPMTEQDHRDAAKHDEDARKKADVADKAAEKPLTGPNAHGHLAAKAKD